MGKWEDLSLNDRHELMKVFMDGGVTNVARMKDLYNGNVFSDGGPSNSIRNYLKKTEGFSGEWYKDGNGVPTIGYGFTGKYFRDKYPDGMTREQADKEFDRVINKFAGYVKTFTPNYNDLNQNQKDALLSYMYNVGPGNYQTRHPEFIDALRNKDYETAARYMDIGYNDSRNPGLKKRRQYEQSLFLGNSPEVEVQQTKQDEENAYKDMWFESLGVSPEVRRAAEVGSIAYRPEEQLFNDTTPLSNFSYSGEYSNPYPTQRAPEARPQPQESNSSYAIPSNEAILEQLFSNINAQQDYDYTGNLFVKGGPTEEERQQAIAAVLANRGNVNVAPVSFDDNQFKAQRDAVQVRHNPAVEQAMETQAPAQFKQLTDEAYFTEGKLLGETDKAMIRNRMSQMKTPEQVKEFQKTLVEHGYDIGKSGVDGKFGTKTRAAAQKYFNDIIKNRQQLQEERIEAVEPVAHDAPIPDLALQISRDISGFERNVNRATLYPEHGINQLVGRIANERSNAAADAVEEASKNLREAIKSGDEDIISQARQDYSDARDQLLKVPGRKGLTRAEQKQALAILTSLNGDRQMTYDDYLKRIEALGKEPGSFLGTGAYGTDTKGNEVQLYGGNSSYAFTNSVEDDAGNIQEYDEKHGYKKIKKKVDGKWIDVLVDKDGNELSMLEKIMRTDARIKTDPNRGRLGAWSYRVLENGDIEIIDNFEATENKENIAKGRNDDSGYNDSRSFWKRGTTHKLHQTIKKKKYDKVVEKAKESLSNSDN